MSQEQNHADDDEDRYEQSLVIGDKIMNTKELDEMLEDMLPDHTVPEKDRFLKLLAFLSLYPLGLGDIKQPRVTRSSMTPQSSQRLSDAVRTAFFFCTPEMPSPTT